MRGLELLQAVLVLLDHLFDHLATDRTGLLGGQIAVVALFQGHADFVGSFHLETVEAFASFGNQSFVARPTSIHSSVFLAAFTPLLIACVCIHYSGSEEAFHASKFVLI